MPFAAVKCFLGVYSFTCNFVLPCFNVKHSATDINVLINFSGMKAKTYVSVELNKKNFEPLWITN